MGYKREKVQDYVGKYEVICGFVDWKRTKKKRRGYEECDEEIITAYPINKFSKRFTNSTTAIKDLYDNGDHTVSLKLEWVILSALGVLTTQNLKPGACTDNYKEIMEQFSKDQILKTWRDGTAAEFKELLTVHCADTKLIALPMFITMQGSFNKFFETQRILPPQKPKLPTRDAPFVSGRLEWSQPTVRESKKSATLLMQLNFNRLGVMIDIGEGRTLPFALDSAYPFIEYPLGVNIVPIVTGASTGNVKEFMQDDMCRRIWYEVTPSGNEQVMSGPAFVENGAAQPKGIASVHWPADMDTQGKQLSMGLGHLHRTRLSPIREPGAEAEVNVTKDFVTERFYRQLYEKTKEMEMIIALPLKLSDA